MTLWKAGFIYTRMEAIGTSCYLADCLVMAITRRRRHLRATSALTPGPDNQLLMSGFVLVSSGSPPTPDVDDTLRIRGVMTQSGLCHIGSSRTERDHCSSLFLCSEGRPPLGANGNNLPNSPRINPRSLPCRAWSANNQSMTQNGPSLAPL